MADALLLHAVGNGDKVQASRHLKAGADPNSTNLNGSTPVHVRRTFDWPRPRTLNQLLAELTSDDIRVASVVHLEWPVTHRCVQFAAAKGSVVLLELLAGSAALG